MPVSRQVKKARALEAVKNPAQRSAKSRSGKLAGMSFKEQQAALSPAAGKVSRGKKKEKEEEEIYPTFWSSTVRSNFSKWDKNGDGFIGHKEANELLSDQSIKGDEAAALAALHCYLKHLEEESNDEWFDENDGLTRADLRAYEGNDDKGRKNSDDLRHVESTNSAGRRAIWRKSEELFPNGVPNLAALRQGGLGDCYFLAALGAVIERDPRSLVRMIEKNEQGKEVISYTVTFPGKLGAVTVDKPTDAQIARYSSAGGDGLWLTVMELAYAQARAGTKEPNPNVQEEIGEGGLLSTGISAMTGNSVNTDANWATRQKTHRSRLDKAFRDGKIVTAAIMSKNELNLPKGHAYSVIAWDGTNVTIRNPWGSNPGKAPGSATGVFQLTLGRFDEIFSEISYEE